MYGATPFQPKENALIDILRALQKGHFCSFAEKAAVRSPGPPLVAHLIKKPPSEKKGTESTTSREFFNNNFTNWHLLCEKYLSEGFTKYYYRNYLEGKIIQYD